MPTALTVSGYVTTTFVVYLSNLSASVIFSFCSVINEISLLDYKLAN